VHRDAESEVMGVGLGPTGLAGTASLTQEEGCIAAVDRDEYLCGLPGTGHVDYEIFHDDACPIGRSRWDSRLTQRIQIQDSLCNSDVGAEVRNDPDGLSLKLFHLVKATDTARVIA